MEEKAEVGRENIPGGKAVAVALMKQASASKRAADNQTGASGLTSRTA